jgi:hypothetical protein
MPALPSDEYDVDPSTPESRRAEELQPGQLLRPQSPEDLRRYGKVLIEAIVEAKPEVGGILLSIQVSNSAFPAKVDSKLYPTIFNNSAISKSAVKKFRQKLARYNSRRRTYTVLRSRVKKLQPASRKFMVEPLQPLHQDLETLYAMLIRLFSDNINDPQAPEEDLSNGDEGKASARELKNEPKALFRFVPFVSFKTTAVPPSGVLFRQSPIPEPPYYPQALLCFWEVLCIGSMLFSGVIPCHL